MCEINVVIPAGRMVTRRGMSEALEPGQAHGCAPVGADVDEAAGDGYVVRPSACMSATRRSSTRGDRRAGGRAPSSRSPWRASGPIGRVESGDRSQMHVAQVRNGDGVSWPG